MQKTAYWYRYLYERNRALTKTLLIMKLTTVFLTALFLNVHATGISQSVTLSGDNLTLKSVFAAIEKQTGYGIFGNTQMLKDSKPVSVHVRDMPLRDLLDLILKDQPLQYRLTDKTIILSRKPEPEKPEKKTTEDLLPDFLPVTGIVKNADGEPLSGVSVQVKGSTKVTLTDANGAFTIDAAPDGTLLISYVGYASQEKKITGKIIVVLQRSISILDETQVIAYGKTSRRLTTGDVTTVKASDIENQPVTNPLLAMQGLVPGIVITQQSGVPNSAVKVEIRGRASLNANIVNDPIYIVDGIPYASTLLPDPNPYISGPPNATATTPGGNPLNFIDPSSIESIEILKDADATSIYGSRGANGVVLITTKKGKAGPVRLNMNLSQGISQLAGNQYLHLMNTRQYVAMRKEAIRNNGLAPSATDYDVNGTWDTTRNIDWQRVLEGGNARYTDAQVSVSGGTPATQYLVAGRYNRQTTVFPGDFSDQKIGLNFNLTTASANQRFKMGFSGSYLSDDNHLPGNDPASGVSGDLYSGVLLAPDAPNLFKPDGSLNWGGPLNDFGVNPMQNSVRQYFNKTNNLMAGLTPSYRLAKGLELKATLGYNQLLSDIINTTPKASLSPQLAAIESSNAQYTTNAIRYWNIEPQLTYDLTMGRSKWQGLLGGTMLHQTKDGEMLTGAGYTSDALIGNIKNATTITAASTSSYSEYKYSALFGRISYNLSDKYLLNANVRRDGSSRFGPGRQFHTFLSLGTAWIFSGETWMKDNVPVLSFGKLRGSYGTTGSDAVGDYQYLALYAAGGSNNTYQGASVLTASGLSNPNFAWEETKKLELSLDLGFLKDRILLSAAWYRNRCSNQLLGYPLPNITGFATVTTNLPATVQNSGVEFTLNTVNIKSSTFSWLTSFNLSANNNKLLSYPGLAQSSYASTYAIGQPVSGYSTAFRYGGVDPQTGLFLIKRKDGSTTGTPAVADAIKMKTLPKYFGGFNNTFSYKGFQLDVLLQFAKQMGQQSELLSGKAPGQSTSQNAPLSVLDRWQKPGDITPFEKVSSANIPAYSTWLSTDVNYVDASFIRVKNVALSYALPGDWKGKAGLQNCRIFLRAENLFTLTRYVGRDPENQNAFSLPPLRTVTGGIQLTF